MKRHRFQEDIRKTRKEKHLARALKENEQMLAEGESIKIHHWEAADKPNGWMVVRLKFTNPIIPQSYERELRSILEKVFDGHL